MISAKNITSNILKQTIGLNQASKIENFSLDAPNTVYVMKNFQFPKLHKFFYEIIAGEKFVKDSRISLNYKIVNYFSLKKRFDLEKDIFDNMSKIMTEDLMDMKDLYQNYHKLMKFLNFDINSPRSLENYSTGQISKIIYSLPIFLKYDVYIFSKIPPEIDVNFETSIYLEIKELSKKKILFFDFYSDFLVDLFSIQLNFQNLNNICLEESKNMKKLKNIYEAPLMLKTGEEIFNESNLSKYIDHLKINFPNGSKLKYNLSSNSNFEISIDLKSKLKEEYTFKFGLNIQLNKKSIIVQTCPKWFKIDEEKKVKMNINLPNIFINGIYDFYLTIKVEHELERNKDKMFRIIENFNIARIQIDNDNLTIKDNLVRPEYLFA